MSIRALSTYARAAGESRSAFMVRSAIARAMPSQRKQPGAPPRKARH